MKDRLDPTWNEARPISRLSSADRWIGIGLAAFAVAYGLIATTFRTALLADPVGPRAFPLLLAGAMLASSATLGLRPSTGPAEWPSASLRSHGAILTIALVAYGYLLEPLGYLVSTMAIMFVMCRLFGGPIGKSLVSGGGLVIALYLLFSVLLDLYLPAGPSL
jgi:putative tricarboxylic transport membrane protein